MRAPQACPMKMKVVKHHDTGSYVFFRFGTGLEHSHTLDYSDIVKKPGILRRLAASEMASGYAAATVTHAMQVSNRLSDGRGGVTAPLNDAGGRFMSRKDVANTGQGWRAANPDPRFSNGKSGWEDQVKEAEQWLALSPEGYRAAILSAVVARDGSASECLLWALPERLRLLCRRGHLALMDSTHCSNKLGWPLYTVMVRDEQGHQRPAAHFLARRQDGDIVASALKELRRWTGGVEGWRCRWFLTDDSAAEQKAVREAFPPVRANRRQGTSFASFIWGRRLPAGSASPIPPTRISLLYSVIGGLGLALRLQWHLQSRQLYARDLLIQRIRIYDIYGTFSCLQCINGQTMPGPSPLSSSK
jgi:hypothetical protein